MLTCGPYSPSDLLSATPLEFEKDDDLNGHIDFITAASVRVYNMSRSKYSPWQGPTVVTSQA